MSESTIRSALGVLQDEPDNEQAWSDLRTALGCSEPSAEGGRLTVDPGSMDRSELASLLEAARRAHEARREYDAVSELLELESALATGDRAVELTLELARVRDEILIEDAAAVAAYRRVLVLRPDHEDAKEGIERSEVKRGKWKDLAQKYFAEAKAANDGAFKSSLLVSAAEIAYR
ncbi:MAG TPA: hypothetical protein VM580_24100, partial [Labilithrix sp.]|nr:hypothetical protein [Labilithrix sp.]